MTEPQPNPPDAAAEPLELTRRVTAAEGGVRLDVFLAQQEEIATRVLAKALIKDDRVRVDGARCKPGQALSPGQSIRFHPTLRISPQVSTEDSPVREPEILFEDDCLLVVDKPAGLVSHPSGATRSQGAPSLSGWAEAYCPGLPTVAGEDRPGIVHRLDRETSGVMVVAKTEDAFHFLKGEFKARRVVKEYRAICYGESRFDSDMIERNLMTHPQKGDRVVVVLEGGREATTFYEVLERFPGITYFACRPKTGRTHQIRVHMTSVGHSLVGDRMYRSRNHSNSKLPPGAPDPGRHCLHAHRLSFQHPQSREPVEFVSELPDDMAGVLTWLRGNP